MASPPSTSTTLSSSSSSTTTNYPCPADVNVVDFVPLKLGPTNYFVWKQLMLDFIESHGLLGFVDGTIPPPPPLPESGEKEAESCRESYKSWKRSDGVVRGWIFVMVIENILLQVVRLKTAREVWIALEKMLTMHFQEGHYELDWTNKEKATFLSRYLPMHKAALKGDWDAASEFIKEEPDAIRDSITWCYETALIVAIRSAKRNHFVKNLVAKMSAEDLAARDISGATALHAAVHGGNIEAAMLLVEKNPELPNIGDFNRTLAVHMAAMIGNRKMVEFLLEVTKEDGDPRPFEDETGHKLLFALAFSGLYDIALSLLQRYPKLASMEPSPLVVIAQKRSSFYSGTRLNIWQHLIYSSIPLKLKDNANQHKGGDIENHAKGFISSLAYVRQKLHAAFWDLSEKIVPQVKSIRKTKLVHHQALELVKCLCKGVVKSDFSKASEIFKAPMGNATCVGVHEMVEEILEAFPSGIHLRSGKLQTIFQMAIVCRREKVFNLIYQLEEGRHLFLSSPDTATNNALHLAGSLAPQQQLSLRASAAGAALQMQRELQWFKEVEKLLLPQDKEHMNAEGKTPNDVFTETHKELVKEGEQWMKDTATSCTIVAALVATVVFAAAITVPGGNDGDTGRPTFFQDRVFILFGISDALALFSSTASVLMFLSILTSRYAEQDFLYSLPRRLIIGLVTLFLSILAMMVAFGATLHIVFGYKKGLIMIPVAALSCLPVTLFALLQFPLLLDMIKSTYYPGIFRKQSDRILF